MADDMKKCKYCGREIGKDTNFCWYCGRELEARPERPEVPQKESRLDRWLLLGVGAAVALIALAILLSSLFH
jgi:predicted amidophosphoribosyltransferase